MPPYRLALDSNMTKLPVIKTGRIIFQNIIKKNLFSFEKN